ncbi:hypothetical protein Rleg4DRAFT_0225 [Rhizobium leguminosarum bv. trifolii WSM2297]|uniref:Lytic murein transglycosylase n=1 Tax=Rhizobium leguminosarum bv. trifolii WSM2297 TaxID=754762 RepID=J0C6S7_RHILT|nr:hypothetical protein Rleg4DRAFT_0225 [Rhizobium leguminosarum bv. trifolii WSM2297]
MLHAVTTPLCPAGHLPHKEGDQLGVGSLPKPRWSGLQLGEFSISPHVGEMPGRAEGGKPHIKAVNAWEASR